MSIFSVMLGSMTSTDHRVVSLWPLPTRARAGSQRLWLKYLLCITMFGFIQSVHEQGLGTRKE